jgi:hypothetical protein
MKKWKSHAEWPEPNHGVQFSEDTHDTREQAQSVCDMLQREGLGGEGKVFPIQTWVTEIKESWWRRKSVSNPNLGN